MSVPEILDKIRVAEANAGRPSGSVQLVAVTKGFSVAAIAQEVLAFGSFPLAESRGQELRDKSAQLGGVQWHFIGPLQRNKIKYLEQVTLVHSVEDVWQAEALAQAAEKWGRAPDVLLQRHNGEAQKHGFLPAELPSALQAVQSTGLKVRGLMTMAPFDNKQAAAQVFTETAAQAQALGLAELSMGMSGDYQVAIAAGATLVRVGRALFSSAQKPDGYSG